MGWGMPSLTRPPPLVSPASTPQWAGDLPKDNLPAQTSCSEDSLEFWVLCSVRHVSLYMIGHKGQNVWTRPELCWFIQIFLGKGSKGSGKEFWTWAGQDKVLSSAAVTVRERERDDSDHKGHPAGPLPRQVQSALYGSWFRAGYASSCALSTCQYYSY